MMGSPGEQRLGESFSGGSCEPAEVLRFYLIHFEIRNLCLTWGETAAEFH